MRSATTRKIVDLLLVLAIVVAAGLLISGLFMAVAKASDLAKPELIPISPSSISKALTVDLQGKNNKSATLGVDAATSQSSILQLGNANQANVSQMGKSLTVNLTQIGNFNTVFSTQTGLQNSLELTQQGSGNQASFIQSGNSRASLSQIGDLHKAEINQSSTAPTIAVRQTGTGTVVQTTQY